MARRWWLTVANSVKLGSGKTHVGRTSAIFITMVYESTIDHPRHAHQSLTASQVKRYRRDYLLRRDWFY